MEKEKSSKPSSNVYTKSEEMGDNHTKSSQSDSETPASYAITYMWNLKKGHNGLLCRTNTDSQTLKTYSFQRRQGGGRGNALRDWDGNAIKFGCDDRCTMTNAIKLIE